MKLEFCVACGSKSDLKHHHLVTKAKGGSDAEPNRITLCTSCHDKLHQQRYGARKHSQRIKTAIAARRARGASFGRPKKLMPYQCEEALQRLESGETKAAVARSFGLSKSTVSRIVAPHVWRLSLHSGVDDRPHHQTTGGPNAGLQEGRSAVEAASLGNQQCFKGFLP